MTRQDFTASLIRAGVDAAIANFAAVIIDGFGAIPETEDSVPYCAFLAASVTSDFLSYTHRDEIPDSAKADLARNIAGGYLRAEYTAGHLKESDLAGVTAVHIGDVSVSLGDHSDATLSGAINALSKAGADNWRRYRRLSK